MPWKLIRENELSPEGRFVLMLVRSGFSPDGAVRILEQQLVEAGYSRATAKRKARNWSKPKTRRGPRKKRGR